MEKIFFVTICAFLLLCTATKAQTDSIPDNAFEAGEELVYDVRYSGMKGGEATVFVELVPHGYGYVYHAKARVVSTGAIEKVVTVDHVYESYFDIYTGLPVMFVNNLVESNYRYYNEIRFDRDRNEVISMKSGKHKADSMLMDVLSAFYFARRGLFVSLTKNQVLRFKAYFHDRVLDFGIRFKGYDKIKSDFGKIECLHFNTLIDGEDKIKKENDLQVWFSNDGNYIPIKIEVDMPVGSIKMELKQYKGLKKDLKVLQK